jgi:hypothetical protein
MIPIRLLSLVNGKFYKILYFSMCLAAFSICMNSAPLSKSFMFRLSANFTNATSSGEDA